MRKILLSALLLAAPTAALGQAIECRPPVQIPRPRPDLPQSDQTRGLPPIGGYTFALSWSPQYCADARGRGDNFQCSGRNGRFGFTLHGLWPDGVGNQWPQYCRAADLLPRNVIRQNLCTTPSAQLLQHEWAKHGTCMTTKPDLYFNLSRTLYQSIRYPDMVALSRRSALTVGQFAQAFAAANKGMTAGMIRVRTTRESHLSEVWLCMDRALEFVRCTARQGGAPRAARLKIAPGPRIPNLPRVSAPPRRPALILDLDPNAKVPAD